MLNANIPSFKALVRKSYFTKKTGNSWFWSRSRNKLWMKGEESGNTQKIKEILVDCDFDAIIYLVEPSGPACHTGEKVCFHNQLK